MTMAENLKFSKHMEIKGKAAYDRYDNYDAIEVPLYNAIPSDYDGVMGVPITFLDKYNPDQFEIVGTKTSTLRIQDLSEQSRSTQTGSRTQVTKLNDGAASSRSGKPRTQTYYIVTAILMRSIKRILIRHRARPARGTKK